MSENSLYPILVISEQELKEMPFGELQNKFKFEAVKPSEEILPVLRSKAFAIAVLYKIKQNERIIKEIRSAFDMAQIPIAVLGTVKTPKNLYELGANQYLTNSVSLQDIEVKLGELYSFSETHRRLFAEEERLKLAVKGANSGIFDYDLLNTTANYSPRCSELLALAEGEAASGAWKDLTANIHPEEKDIVIGKIENHLQGGSPRLEIQFRVLYPDGTHRWILMRGEALRKDGAPVRLTGTVNDISSSLSYDNITGLPGRHIFFDLLERSMVKVMRNENLLFGLLNITINNFEELSGKLSAKDMDFIWNTVSRRLQMSSRASDLISRIETNSFAVLLEDLREISDAMRVACRMDKSLSATIYTDDDEEINLDIGIGAAVSRDMYESPEQILEEACKAAALAPKQGRYRCRMCNPDYQQPAESRLTLESELYEAIAGRQIRPYYLPIVRLTDRRVVGLEVLLRWKHPSGKLMKPEEFLDLCDRDQIIIPIGYELIKNVVEQMNRVCKIKAIPDDFKIDFNLTDRQYYDEELLDNIALICQKSEVKPHHIRFEVSEEIINKNFEAAAYICENMHNAGIGCIIDRFGTSPLSFSNLLTFKAAGLKSNYKNFLDEEDRLKASRVCQIGHDMAKFLDIEFIASGINSLELSEAMREEDCLIQEGFAFGMPLTVTDLEVIAENGYILP